MLEDGVPPEDLPYLVVDSLASADASLDATVSGTVIKDCQIAISKLFQNHDIDSNHAESSAVSLVAILKNYSPKMLAPTVFTSEIIPKVTVLLDSMAKLKIAMG